MKTKQRLISEGLLLLIAVLAVAVLLERTSSNTVLQRWTHPELLASGGVTPFPTAIVPAAIAPPRPTPSLTLSANGKASALSTVETTTVEATPIPRQNDSLPVAKDPFPGYTLYGTCGTAEVLLTNLNGDFVHRWDVDADRARLLPNGNLLVIHGSKWGLHRAPWAELRSVVREYSWEGETVWEVPLPDDAHHDIARLPNGNTLILYLTRIPKETLREKLGPKFEDLDARSDVIVEVDREGQEVWRWEAHNHLPLTECGIRPCPDLTRPAYRSGKKRFDWTHVNTVREIPPNKWFRAGDARFRPGNIIILPRNFWTTMIIDKETKEVVWRFSGTEDHQISGGHESYMIEEGLPGAGNILIFDNGRVHRRSAVLEVNPQTNEIVWSYSNGKEFFSGVAGAAQRLPNGNTLISEDTTGRIFEVNRAGETVWTHHAYKLRINRAHRYPVGFTPQLTKDLL
jgi:hypothetical protein